MHADGSGQTGKSIVIIGGGIAGLCAGCYAQMNGCRSRIYEMHDLPDGLMTAWEPSESARSPTFRRPDARPGRSSRGTSRHYGWPEFCR